MASPCLGLEKVEPKTTRDTLVLTQPDWDRLHENLKRNDAEAAAVDAAVAKRRAMKDKSKQLQKKWCERGGVGLKKSHRKQVDARHDDREEALQDIRREREEEKSKYLTVCARLMFYTVDGVKTLNRALVFSEILRERKEQLKFQDKLKAIEDEREAAYAARVKQNAQGFERDMYEARKSKEMRTKEYQCTILKQVKEEQEKIALARETQTKLEMEASEKFNKEFEIDTECKRETAVKRRADLRRSALENLHNDRTFKEMKRLEDEEENKVISVYSAAKQKIAQQCKRREKELQEEVVRRRQAVLEKLVADLKARQDNETENIRKAIEKRRVDDEKARLEKEVYQEKLVGEIIQGQREYLEGEEHRKAKEKQAKKWIVLQRYETEEVSDQFARRREQKRQEAMASLRVELDKQIVEKELRLESERKEDIQSFNVKKALMRAEDSAFFQYAAQVVDESKKIGRPIMPIERAVEKYKVHNSLIPKKKANPSMMSTIPFGRALLQPK